jgi:hypothetical protein
MAAATFVTASGLTLIEDISWENVGNPFPLQPKEIQALTTCGIREFEKDGKRHKSLLLKFQVNNKSYKTWLRLGYKTQQAVAHNEEIDPTTLLIQRKAREGKEILVAIISEDAPF